MALTRGADHTREDLLGPCAAGRPIPATDLAIDDGGADGVFSAPVGRVDVGGPQEGEHSRELAVEMPGEALGRRQSGRRVDEPAQAGKQAPAGPSEALLGDRVGIPPIAEREGVGEDGLHAGCPRAPRMVGTERATPAEQMCQAALVQRAGEAAIGRPSVADQHTGEVRAQDRDRIVKATPGADRIHGGLRCRERPQPVQHGTDAPAGFIRTDDGTPPDLSAESRVRGRRYPGRAMQDLSKSSRRDRQPEPVLQQCCDLLQRHAHVFVQQDRKRHGARTELYACRAQGVGGLQRVPALHAVPACDAAPDLNVEPPHDWLDDGQVFLVLGRDASGLNRPTTARARHGKRRGIRLIHPRRNRSPAATSIGGTCPPARSPAVTLRAVLRKRGGLSKARAPRRVELLLETLASSLPSIAIACRAGQLLTQAGNLILVALDQLVAFVARRSRALVDHACVMSYPRKLYKPNSLDLLPSPAKQRLFSQNLRESGDITWIAIHRPLRNIEVRGTTQDDGSWSYEFRHELHFGGTGVERPRGTTREQIERVTAVRITGTPGFDEHEPRDRLRLRAGDRFNFYRWQQDRERLERLYQERGFLEARISARRSEADGPSAKGVALEYDIDRGPRTTLTIDGHTLPNDVVERMKEAWGRAVFDGFLLDDLGMMAKRQLLGEGYLQAEVQGMVAAGADGDVKEIVLHIVPGLRFDQRRMSFTGHERLSAAALAAVVRARGLDATAWLQPEELRVSIERQYQSLGYLGATVTVDAPVFSGRSATLPVRIAEGRQFRVARLSVLGTGAKSEAAVRKVFDITADSTYLPSRVEPARRAVELGYLRDGYNDVRVSVTTLVDREGGRVDVTLNVDEGPQQVLSGIEVSGAEVTASTVINRALDLEPGQPVNLTETYRAQKSLYDTGVFQTADIELRLRPVEGDATGPVQPVRALVTLAELPRYRFRYGLRVSDQVAPTEVGREVQPGLVVDLLRRNLFGRVVSTGVAGQLEADRRLARGVVSVPKLFGLPVTTNFFPSGSRETFTAAASTPFVEDKSEITAEQRFRPANRMAVSYGYSFSRAHIFEPDPIPSPLPVLELQTNVARLTGTFAWDTRDDPSNARSGSFQSSGLELGTASLGSDLRFIKYLAQQYYFKSAWHGLVLASAFRLGVGRGFDQDLIPSEKFFAGGRASVRGFAEDSLGARDFFGDPKGGNSLLILNQELRVPLFKWVRGVSFIDAGNVFPLVKDLSLKDLEAGAGFGLRINSPFTLVRIDYGMPLTRRNREPFGRWYFAIGQTF